MPIIGIMASANWASANASSFESIATVTAAGGETSLSFSSIPSTYKAIQLRYRIMAQTSNNISYYFRINSDSGTNYARHYLLGDGASASAFGQANTATPYSAVGMSNANYWLVGIADIIDYASTSKTKTLRYIEGNDRNSASAPVGNIALESILWNSTSAINNVSIQTNNTFAAGSTIALYGIRG